jgi:hypothetical protein
VHYVKAGQHLGAALQRFVRPPPLFSLFLQAFDAEHEELLESKRREEEALKQALADGDPPPDVTSSARPVSPSRPPPSRAGPPPPSFHPTAPGSRQLRRGRSVLQKAAPGSSAGIFATDMFDDRAARMCRDVLNRTARLHKQFC